MAEATETGQAETTITPESGETIIVSTSDSGESIGAVIDVVGEIAASQDEAEDDLSWIRAELARLSPLAERMESLEARLTEAMSGVVRQMELQAAQDLPALVASLSQTVAAMAISSTPSPAPPEAEVVVGVVQPEDGEVAQPVAETGAVENLRPKRRFL